MGVMVNREDSTGEPATAGCTRLRTASRV